MTSPLALVWHITKKDLRRLRWLIALWAALTALQAVLRVVWPPMMLAAYPESFLWVVKTAGWLESARGLLPYARNLLFMEIVVLLVQADSLVTTNAFWLTRPIAPRILFFSKLLTTLVLIVPTCLTQVVLMFVLDVPLFEIVRVIPEILLYTTVGMTIVLIGAALTANQRALLAWTVGVFVLMIIVAAVSVYLDDLVPARQSETLAFTERALTSVGLSHVDAQIAGEVLFAAGFIGAAWHLYRTRRRRRSALIAAVATGVTVFLTVQWPPSLNLSKPRETPVASGIPLAPAVHVNDGPRSLSARPIGEDGDGNCRALVRVTRVQGLRIYRDWPRLTFGFVHRPTGQALSSNHEAFDRLSDQLVPIYAMSSGEHEEAFQLLHRYVWIGPPKRADDGREPQPRITSVSCRDVDVLVKWQKFELGAY